MAKLGAAARNLKLSPEQRSAAASVAARKRWANSTARRAPKSTKATPAEVTPTDVHATVAIVIAVHAERQNAITRIAQGPVSPNLDVTKGRRMEADAFKTALLAELTRNLPDQPPAF